MRKFGGTINPETITKVIDSGIGMSKAAVTSAFVQTLNELNFMSKAAKNGLIFVQAPYVTANVAKASVQDTQTAVDTVKAVHIAMDIVYAVVIAMNIEKAVLLATDFSQGS